MANKDYDDLLRSFMNNSSKAYDEDRHAVEKQAQQAPVQRNAAADRAARHKKEQQMENRLAAKKRKKASKPPKESTPARKLGKVLLGCLMVICVVGIVCCSVLFIYGYSVVHGDKVFDLTEQKYSQKYDVVHLRHRQERQDCGDHPPAWGRKPHLGGHGRYEPLYAQGICGW